MNSPEARAWMKRLKPTREPAAVAEVDPSLSDVMAWAIKTMTADGRVDEGEMKIITKLPAKV